MKVTFIAKARASFSPPKPKEKRYVWDSPTVGLIRKVETTKDKDLLPRYSEWKGSLSLLAIKQRPRQCLKKHVSIFCYSILRLSKYFFGVHLTNKNYYSFYPNNSSVTKFPV